VSGRILILIGVLFSLAGCRGTGLPQAATGRWETSRVFADLGEAPLMDCGYKTPPCRHTFDDRYFPALAMNRAGLAVAAWNRHEGGFRPFASRFNPGSLWSVAEPISEHTGSLGQAVGIDGAGNAIGLWGFDPPVYDPAIGLAYAGVSAWTGAGWGREVLFEGAGPLSLAEDGHGLVFVGSDCGSQDHGGFPRELCVSHWLPQSGWSRPERIRLNPSGCGAVQVVDLRVAPTPGGGALAV